MCISNDFPGNVAAGGPPGTHCENHYSKEKFKKH